MTETEKQAKATAAGKARKVMVIQVGTRTFRLQKERVVVGTVISADVCLTGDGVSPIHAVIESGPAGSVIYDLASDTGIFVNGSKTVSQGLKNGDKITVGRHELEFRLDDAEKIQLPRERVREVDGRKLFFSATEDFTSLLLEEEREVEEIFDYRGTTKAALEVIMSWYGTILDVEHFVTQKAVTLGTTRKSDFGIPPLLSAARYPIVQREDETFWLNLDTQMKGVLQRKGELIPLEELRKRNPASGSQGHRFALEREDFAKIAVGDVDFYFSFTSAPPRLKRQRLFDKDALLLRIVITSLILTAVTITGLLKMTVPPNLEAEQIPERIATILFQPEKYPETPVHEPPVPEVKKPEPVKTAQPVPHPRQTTKLEIHPHANPKPVKIPKTADYNAKKNSGHNKVARPAKHEGQHEAKEGEGKRARGAEGAAGKHNAAANAHHQTKANRPSPNGGKGAGSGHSQVPDEGNVDFLKGATGKIENLLGNSAAQLGKGGERIKNFGGFDTQGEGGLAISGSGTGGGGTAESLGGLGHKGTGGGAVGTGKGAIGNGAGIIGGKARLTIRTGGPEEAVVMGSIDADAVEAALLAHKDEFRLCYEREINAEHPNLAGRVGTNFVIGGNGRVTQAGIESSTLKNSNAERCILTVIRRIDFPAPRGGGIVQVSYPFKYSSVGH